MLIIILAVFGIIFFSIILSLILKKMKGSIQIIPERYSYSPGEEIKGQVILKLKKSASSEKIILGLKCEKRQTGVTFSNNSRSTETTHIKIFDFNYPLDQQKQYAPGEYTYNFSIKVPTSVTSGLNLGGVAGTAGKFVELAMGQNRSLKWDLYSELKCKGVNIEKNLQINIV